MSDCVEKHQLTTKKSIRFKSNSDYWEHEIDIFHFENAFSNLIDNAIKYGGNQIEVTIEQLQEQLLILIQDNGQGISREDEPHIFEKFFRAKKNNGENNIKGFGIGLYYTRNIIEKHSGMRELLNATTFSITLWRK